MQTDILLRQIQQRISQVKASLEAFGSAVQPTSEDSDRLHSELNDLGKLVGAYTFIKQQQELSPRLDLHMKVAEKLQAMPEQEIQVQDHQHTTPARQEETVVTTVTVTEQVVTEPVKTGHTNTEPPQQHPKINVSLNEKFRFINDLFKSNAVEYGIAIEQINAIGNWHDTQVYLNGLKNIYSWPEDHDMVKRIYELGRKRFL